MQARALALCFALAAVAAAAPTASIQTNVTVGRHVCDRLVWADAPGHERTLAVAGPRDGEGLTGGYVVEATYFADATRRVCKATGGALGGFGHLILHGAHARGWANSKEDGRELKAQILLDGPHHTLYGVSMTLATSKGPLPATVYYFTRPGRNDFIYAVTFDATAVKGMAADTRSPYCEFDWEGSGGYGDRLSGFGWASANKQFRTQGDTLSAQSAWNWTQDCPIPHVIEWKAAAAGDAEIGLVQTQTFDQHDGGAGWWFQQGKSGQGLPENWNLTYQLNAYQGYASKKTTWMMPYGAVGMEAYDVFGGTRKASGYPYQSYALFCVLDRHTQGGVDAAVREMHTVHTGAKLTASVGAVAARGPAGAGRPDEGPYAPAGWDHVLAAWAVRCAQNEAQCALDLAAPLPAPTFCFRDYRSPEPPAALTMNGKAARPDDDYLATVDRTGRRLFVTFPRGFPAGRTEVALKGSPNTRFPELSEATLAPAGSLAGVATNVSLTVRVADPDRNMRAVTADLSAVGGTTAATMDHTVDGVCTLKFHVPGTVAAGVKDLAIRAVDAQGNADLLRVVYTVTEPPKAYGAGVVADFADGKAKGWSALNSQGGVSSERGFGNSGFSYKVTPGQWGANPKLEGVDLSRCRKLKFMLWCDVAPDSPAAWPFLWVNEQNSNKPIGPGDKGGVEGGKWVECTADLSAYSSIQSVMLQVYGVKAVYVGRVWGDGVAGGTGAAPPPRAPDPAPAAAAPATPAARVPAAAKAAAPPSVVKVAVDAAKVLHTVSEKEFHGMNFVALWNDTADSPGTARAFSQMGQGLVRFPGGCPAQWYDWKDPLATGWTTLTPELAWRFATAGGSRMLFQTNIANDGGGTNKTTRAPYKFDSSGAHAAAWVQECRQKGIDVAFWEIGNEPEMDAPKEVKAKNSQDAVYAWYNAKFEEQAKAIKQADPKALIMGPATCNTWFWWHEKDLEKFLKAHGNKQGSGLVDAISLHWYPEGGAGTWEQKRGTAQGWAKCMDYIREAIRQYDTRDLPVYITEWNWGAGDKNTGASKLANALGTADTIGMFLRTGVAGQTFFCLQRIDRGWGVLAMKQDCRPQNGAAPTYYALRLAALLGGRVLETTCSADQANVLSAYATRRKDGSLQVMLINKSSAPISVELTCAGIALGGRAARVYTLAGVSSQDPAVADKSSVLANDVDVVYNGVATPNPAAADLPAPRELKVAGPVLSQALPACSMAVVEVKTR